MSSKCPGQDTRYWSPDDATEVNCAHCGASVEFFKTDGSRRCPGCGERITNPNLSLGCAEWCQSAKECLGFDPKSLRIRRTLKPSVLDAIVAAMRREFGSDERRINHALAVLEHAQAIASEEGGGPRVVAAAAILHDIGIIESERKYGNAEPQHQEVEGPPVARRILKELDLDAETIEHVCRIVGSHHSAADIDTPEFRAVYDADLLVNMAETLAKDPEKARAFSLEAFRTNAGRARAAALLQKNQA